MTATSLRRRAADEGGSVMLLVSISMVMILGFTALTVDIGRLSGERRDLQDVADVISLDVVRELEAQIATHAPLVGPPLAAVIEADPAFQAAVQRSADRNDFPRNQLAVVVGRKDRGVAFIPGPSMSADPVAPESIPNAVEATAGETVDFAFAEGSAATTRRAVAARTPAAGFSIGSHLASVDSTQSRILNKVLGDAFGMQAVSYQGLVGAKVTLKEIGLNMPAGVLTPNELLETKVTIGDLLVASAEALRKDGNLAAVAVLDETLLTATGGITVTVGELLKVGAGGERAAADSKVELLPLLVGQAFVVDKEHAFTLEDLELTIPGVSGVNVNLTAISPPAYAFGPAGVVAETAQVTMTVTPTFSLTTGDLSGDMCKLYGEGLLTLTEELECVPLIGNVLKVLLRDHLVKLDITGSAPMVLTSAEAKGTLADIDCTTGARSITIEPEVGAVTLDQTVDISVHPKVLGRATPPIKVQTAARASAVGGVRPLETFLDPDQFGVPRAVGTTPVGLANLLALDTGKIQLGSVKLHKILDVFGQPLIDQINGALGRVDQQVISRLSNTLGFSLGGADLTALSMDCNAVRLAE